MPELRPYRPGDEQGIRELFAVCHGRPLPDDLWRWRYHGQGGIPAVVDVAVDGGRVVAHLGCLPTTLSRGREDLQAGLWVDLMVHPDYRNLTLFLDMAEANRRHCAVAGMKIVWAFPNDRSYPVLKRMLGWQSIEELDALEAPLAELRPLPVPPRIEAVSAFDLEYDALWRKLRPAEALGGERSSAWLTWRYRRRPGGRYEAWRARNKEGRLSGFIAVKTFDGPDGKIGDILDLWSELESYHALWSAALAHFQAAGVKTVSAWATKESPLFERFTDWGLAPRGSRTHFAGRWTSDDEKAPFPARSRDWSVSKGDSDVF
ncbi:MAG TPA: GNAT family N-acetyltransferase [Elusimicrobiota bacterium]|nr:GNAT family N-acetyltransferase [Elusimicrobiota bacterium]